MTTPINELAALVADVKTKTEAAKVLGVSRVYVSKMLGGHYPMTDEMADRLGYDTIITKQWVKRP